LLPGLGQVLIGDPKVSKSQKYVMLPEVTAIFPSITFASWASIYTGKQPKETGILGNEFFARDLYASNTKIVGLEDYPLGMVTLDADGGAFRPRGGLLPSPRFALKYAIPAEFIKSTYTGRVNLSAPTAALTTDPLWSDIGNRVGSKYQINTNQDENCEKTPYECRTVSIFNQYPKGADQWGTASITSQLLLETIKTMGDGAKLLDNAATDRTVDFISNYFKNNKADNKRKRFPAVFSVYLTGLDHYAHIKGMGDYVDFIKTSTDPKIVEIVAALKAQDEFDNKIFIVVADHGHTAMPIFGEVTLPDGRTVLPDMSCELNVKSFDDRDVADSEQQSSYLGVG
jgi:predicted AlkP superfamily pyrophosphatase or phosphodiesterase